jgi:hypothetical protein
MGVQMWWAQQKTFAKNTFEIMNKMKNFEKSYCFSPKSPIQRGRICGIKITNIKQIENFKIIAVPFLNFALLPSERV